MPVALAVVALAAHDGDALPVAREPLEIRDPGGVEFGRDRREAEPGGIMRRVAMWFCIFTAAAI